jgi:hypothetical protein
MATSFRCESIWVTRTHGTRLLATAPPAGALAIEVDQVGNFFFAALHQERGAVMLGSQVLEVAIGVIFVYLLVSLICTAIREGLETGMKSRAAYLERGIRELLHDPSGENLVRSFYSHPVISSLYTGEYTPSKQVDASRIFVRGGNLPSYIPSRNFALALMDIAVRGQATDVVSSDPNGPSLSLEAIRTNILNLGNPAVQRAVLAAIDTAGNDFVAAQINIEQWFDSGMDRVSGWYKRSTQSLLFVIGLVASIGLNVNTLAVAQYLYRNDAARATAVASAEAGVTNPAIAIGRYQHAAKDLEALDLPIGWARSSRPAGTSVDGGWAFFGPPLGWFMTALAATLGAPFWFDLLNKVMVIRSTVKPHEKSPEEASVDRQGARREAAPLQHVTPGVIAGAFPVRSPVTAAVRDSESDIDGCSVAAASAPPTLDENLPAAEGGFA